MKPALCTAFLVVLSCTGAQAAPDPASVFEHGSHIDDGIYAGPKKRVPRLPSLLWRFRPYAQLGPRGSQGSLDFSVLGGIKRKPIPRVLTLTQSLSSPSFIGGRIARARTLTENLHADRDVRKGTRLKFVSTKDWSLLFQEGRYFLGERSYVLPDFGRSLYPRAVSPYRAFALRSQESRMHNARKIEISNILRSALDPTDGDFSVPTHN